MKTEKMDTAARIADAIISQLKKGVSPWHKPWGGGMIPTSVSGRPYRGINLLLLSISEYKSPYWCTFKKCKELGGSVRKGEHSTLVMYWHRSSYTAKDEDGNPILGADGKPVVKSYMLIRPYYVFNVEQCDGLPDRFYPKPKKPGKADRNKAAEKLWRGYKGAPEVEHGGSEAYYIPSRDEIHLPEKDSFESTDAYWQTLFHEGCHSTGHESRLNRGLRNGFGSEKYGQEELVAEIGSQLLCQLCGITRTIENSAAYCKGWTKAITSMPNYERAIVCAAARAQKAADWIMGNRPGEGKDNDDED